jgi:hypothetical protein
MKVAQVAKVDQAKLAKEAVLDVKKFTNILNSQSNKLGEGIENVSRAKVKSPEAKDLQNKFVATSKKIHNISSSEEHTEISKGVMLLPQLLLQESEYRKQIGQLQGEEELKKAVNNTAAVIEEIRKMMPDLMRVFVFNNSSQNAYANEEQFRKFYEQYMLPSQMFQQLAVAANLDKLVDRMLDMRDNAAKMSVEITNGEKPKKKELEYASASENHLVLPMVKMYCGVKENALDFYADNGFTDVRKHSVPVIV